MTQDNEDKGSRALASPGEIEHAHAASASVRTHEELSAVAERLQLALAAGDLGDWSWDARTDVVILGPRAAEIFGLPREPMSWERMRSILSPEDRERASRARVEALAGRTQYSIEYKIDRPDGSRNWVASRGRGVYDAGGELLGMIGVVQDITERKRAEDALREESHNLDLLNKTGIMLGSKLDLGSLLQSVTDAATELSGAHYGAFLYGNASDQGDSRLLYAFSGAPREAFAHLSKASATPLFGWDVDGGGIIRCDDAPRDPRFDSKSPFHGMPAGRLPLRSYLAVPVISRSGDVVGGLFFGHPTPGVFTVRTEHLIAGIAAQAAVAIDNARLYENARKAADSERAARADIERTSDLKDEFLANLSHELRTPLTAILGWAQMLRRRHVLDATDIREGLEIIERNTRLQVQLIDDLLDTSRITSGKLRIDVQPLEPKTIIEAALETIRPAAEARSIRIESILDPAAGPISGDPGRLQQVMWNLLSNAVKFTPRNGKVQVLLERVNSHIEISVTDTGIGIKPEFLDHVFERFRQADGSPTRRHGGLGLGLSIVKHLVELHGGTVRAASPGEGLGATFTLLLPLTVVRRDARNPQRRHPRAPAPPRDFRQPDLSGIRVLVVDDEPDARELIRLVLEDCGASIIAAESGAEALALIKTHAPDVIVSDIGMPEMDGYEFMRLARERNGRRIPAIALTAFARSEDRTRALQSGFLMHVTKPVEADELVASVACVAGRVGENR